MKSALRIAMLHKTLPGSSGGGVVWQVHQLSNALEAAGHAVTVFSFSDRPADARYDVHRAGPPAVLRGPASKLFSSPWHYAQQSYDSFDVLHAHGDDLLLHRHRPPHVRTYYGSSLSEAQHATTVRGRAFHLCGYALELASSFRADVRVAISEAVRRHVPRIDAVVPCGVDLTLFKPDGEKSAMPSVLFVGTWRGRKRGALLHDLFQNAVRPRLPDAQLWMVCEDGELARINAAGVKVFTRIAASELAALYRRAWVCCHPSTYEGFGLPYVEAMASGTAVLASPNSGAREILGDGNGGVIATDDELANALMHLLTNANVRREMADAGVKKAARYAWCHVVAQYEQAYVLAAGRSTVH